MLANGILLEAVHEAFFAGVRFQHRDAETPHNGTKPIDLGENHVILGGRQQRKRIGIRSVAALVRVGVKCYLYQTFSIIRQALDLA